MGLECSLQYSCKFVIGISLLNQTHMLMIYLFKIHWLKLAVVNKVIPQTNLSRLPLTKESDFHFIHGTTF
jgi:hypothetical protein